jgi:phage/plasmid-associated DNA primase
MNTDSEVTVFPPENKRNAKQKRYEILAANNKFFTFKGQLYLNNALGRLSYGQFSKLCYDYLGFPKIQDIKELYDAFQNKSDDITDEATNKILFADYSVWEMDTLKLRPLKEDELVVYSSAYSPNDEHAELAQKFLLDLAKGDEDLVEDYLQALAPLFMSRRPTGVIWFVGDGANGKSSLIDAMYRLIGNFLTSVTTSALEDGRDVPQLNAILGNLVRESSEVRVNDTERYKALGTHEPFMVHKFHSQEGFMIDADFHTIFNANNIPTFADKTDGTRRRTIIVPFLNKFLVDEEFNDRTFTEEFLSGLLWLILEKANFLKDNHYRYAFSPATQTAKSEYDQEANSAEGYRKDLVYIGVEAFTSYKYLYSDYQEWCSEHGLVSLGITNVKRVFKPFVREKTRTVRISGNDRDNWYFFIESKAAPSDLQQLPMRLGLKVRPEVATELKNMASDELDEELIQLGFNEKKDDG